MAFVVTDGQLAAVQKPSPVAIGKSIRLGETLSADYAEIWRTQQQVRTVCSFLGRNIAQIGAHVYRRVSDVDRERVTNHEVARLLNKPNPRTTRYRMMDSLVQDLGIFDNALLAKIKNKSTDITQGLVRIPPFMVEPDGGNWMWPDGYWVGGKKRGLWLEADSVIHFRGYNPTDSRWGVSPMETLRQMLAEEYEAGVSRQQMWANGARFPGYIKRPKGSTWSDEARKQFQADWNAAYTGQGSGAGGTPILEDDMDFHASGITPHDAQYLEVRKLTREEVAAAYHIPPPMVGILDHATFSNIKEQHQHLYQDTLGPWLKMISEELELQLLREFEDAADLYIEFNMQEKMQGSFEEQAQSLQTSVGGPWLTRNEARARQNLPQIEGGDDLITPLNVITGGQASPTDSAPKARSQIRTKALADASQESKAEKVLRKFFRRQRDAVLSALGAKADRDWWDGKRWDAELSADLLALSLTESAKLARATLDEHGQDPDTYDVERTRKFLAAVAAARAESINTVTRQRLEEVEDWEGEEEEPPAPADVFVDAIENRSPTAALTLMTTIAGFATIEAAKQASSGKATKTWNVTSANPRPSHAVMDGETVAIDAAFSNGANWPGDSSALDVDDVAGCSCSVSVNF